jgi:hypothetical protein
LIGQGILGCWWATESLGRAGRVGYSICLNSLPKLWFQPDQFDRDKTLEITVSLRILIYKLEKLAMADLRRGGLLNGLRVADGVSREARGEREREREREST